MSTAKEPTTVRGWELQRMLDAWVERGIFRGGEVYRDEQGAYWVRVDAGWAREWPEDQFEAYLEGIADATRWHLRREQ